MTRRRTKPTWYTAVLREPYWGSAIETLDKALKRADPAATLWWPEITPDGRHRSEGTFGPYVFYQSSTPQALRQARCVESVMLTPIAEAELLTSVGQPVPLPIGCTVRATAGDYRGVEGTVRQVTLKTCKVKVLLPAQGRSRVVTLERHAVERI